MLNSVVESFSAKAQMVNSLPGCWDRNLDTLTRPLTSIQSSPFCCAWRSQQHLEYVRFAKRTLLGLGLRRSRQPSADRKKYIKKASGGRSFSTGSSLNCFWPCRTSKAYIFQPRPKGVPCRILPWTSRPHQAGGSWRIWRWHPSLQRSIWSTRRQDAERKFETFKTRPFKNTHTHTHRRFATPSIVYAPSEESSTSSSSSSPPSPSADDSTWGVLFDHVGWVDHVELRRRVLPSGGQDGRLTTRVLGQEFWDVEKRPCKTNQTSTSSMMNP